jgi:sporulation protein YlmC with PRC-barrel domain
MITELKGVWLISHEEGAIVGKVSGITIDHEKKAVMALAFKPTKGGPDGFVLTEKIERVGRDVILVRSEEDAVLEKEIPGRDLKALQGCWITTMDGNHVGTLVDLDFTSDWQISELELEDNKRLPVVAAEIKLGDEVLVPADYADKVKDGPEEKYGAFGRLIGSDRIDDMRDTIKKVLSRKPKADE